MKKPSYLLHPLRSLLRHARRPAPGTPPGTLTAEPGAAPPRIRVLVYGPDGYEEHELRRPEEVEDLLGRWPVLWANVDGVGHPGTMKILGRIFRMHRLALEDAANVPQRAKVDDYDGQLFMVARMVGGGVQPGCAEQLSLLLGSGFVVTFQEREGDPLDPVRERIRHGGRIREGDAGYLAYSILDAVVDHYFPVLEAYADRLDALEEEILGRCSRETLGQLHVVKREMMALRRALWPMRDAVSSLLRDAHPQISDGVRVYLRDVYDHTVQAIELLETYRDLTSSLSDLYLSTASNRMNEIMKVLTLFSAIFIPLGFIAGLYGMNFDYRNSPLNMPELHWYWGYPFALTLMGAVGVGLLAFFWRKGWIGRSV